MKRAALALMLALAAAPAARAGGSATCLVLADPRGDVAAAGTAETAAQPAWLDLTGLRVTSGPGRLALTIDVPRLRDLDPATPGRAVYETTWRAGGLTRFARAAADAGRWTFRQGTYRADGTSSASRAGGSVGPGGVTVRAPAAGVLTDLRATAAHLPAAAATATFADRAPNLGTRGATVRAGDPCAGAVDASGARCLVAADATDDARVARTNETPSDGATDAAEIAGLDLRVNDTTLVVEIRLGSAQPIRGADGERWEASWENPWFDEQRAPQAAFAERRGGRLEFGYDAGSGWTSTQGALLTETSTVRILVPRDALRLPDGTRIQSVVASASAMRGATTTMRDRAPDAGGAAWVAGPGCSQAEAPVCPVAIDVRGDGRLVEADGSAPRNEGWLDVRAAGAASAPGVLVLSVRVEDLRADPPAGADLSGWTVSWDHAGRRYYAQAERGADGVTYRYGARTDGAGPAFRGVRAHGEVDPSRDLITIVVPRGSVGAPADGAVLDGFVAAAWASYGTGDTTATIQVVDRTPVRRYLVGADCGA